MLRRVVYMKGMLLLGALCASMSFTLVTQAQDEVVNGGEIYKNFCAVCHGDLGDGMTRARRGLNPPPRNFTTRIAKAELSDERMLNSVTHGRPGTAMMAFDARLSAQQIQSVVAHIKDQFMLTDDVLLSEDMVSLERGKNIYVSNCAVCHGDDGGGSMWTKTSLNPPPRDFTTLQSMEELTRERMLSSVSYGRPGTAMMSFAKNLSKTEIEAVVDYVRNEFIGRVAQVQSDGEAVPSANSHAASPHSRQPAQPPRQPDADMSLAFPGNLVGQVQSGEAFFIANCSTCHGEQGNGDGPRSNFIRPKPRNFLSDDSRRLMNRPALYRAIALGKQGTVMPSWDKVLSAQQIADVAEFVFSTFIKPVEVQEETSTQSDPEKKKVSS
jgi:mono/diheme cytochrome c family protein